jgi:hypothetical protein
MRAKSACFDATKAFTEKPVRKTIQQFSKGRHSSSGIDEHVQIVIFLAQSASIDDCAAAKSLKENCDRLSPHGCRLNQNYHLRIKRFAARLVLQRNWQVNK